jgi:hypothetical protein
VSGNINRSEPFLGQPPIIFACDWPEGLKLLIDLGAGLEWDEYKTPIEMAFNLQYAVCVMSLLTAGCSLARISDCLKALADWPLNDPDRALVIQGLVQGLKHRRTCLGKLALENLAPPDYLRKPEVWGVLDTEAHAVASALEKSGIDVPKALEVPRSLKGVYHSIAEYEGLLDVAEAFWKAGFFDMDGRDVDGFTPLRRIWERQGSAYRSSESTIEMAAWLCEKSYLLSLGHGSRHAWHLDNLLVFCAEFGRRVHFDDLDWELERIRSSNASVMEFWSTIIFFQSPASHSCRCRCCAAGCSGLSQLFRSWSRGLTCYPPTPRRRMLWQLLSTFADDEFYATPFAYQVIRIELFSHL